MPLAKGLSSGVPVGAVVAGPKAAKIFTPGSHGSTFGGQPLAMRAGYETICIMEDDKLLDNAAAMGAHFRSGFERELKAEFATGGVKEIRGQGLMIGIELAKPCAVLVGRCAEAGLLLSVTADSVVRLLPPLTINAQEVDAMVAIASAQIKKFLSE
jgi:acetylornithine/N-succinyldiaminopimelate aminotransferase